jgi:hypothetical protein
MARPTAPVPRQQRRARPAPRPGEPPRAPLGTGAGEDGGPVMLPIPTERG